MERNQGYIYKMEKQQPQQKPIEDVMKGLDLARENNIKILQTLQADIKTLQKKNNGYTFKEGVDPISELNQKLASCQDQIQNTHKDIKAMKLTIERASKNIKQTTDAAADQASNYKKFNDLRTQIVHLTKRNDDLQKRQEQLGKNISEMETKDQDLAIKFGTSKKTAEDKYLEVTTNKNFIEVKKKYLELTSSEDNIKKIIENNKRRTKYYEETYDKEFIDLRKELQKLQENQAVKETQIGVVNRQIKAQIDRCSAAQRQALKAILARFSTEQEDKSFIPKPIPSKKNYIETSSTLKNMDLQPLIYNSRHPKNQRSSSQSEPQNKDSSNNSIFKPLMKKKQPLPESQPKERQWKQEKPQSPKLSKNPEPKQDVDFALEEPKQLNAKPAFRLGRKRNEPNDSHVNHNVSMPIISDIKRNELKEQSTLEPKPEPQPVINSRPRLLRQLRRPEQSNYSPDTSVQVKEPQKVIKQPQGELSGLVLPNSMKNNEILPDKKDVSPVMVKPFQRRKRMESLQKDLPVKPIEAPTHLEPVNDKNPFMKDYAQKNKLKLDRPTKIKIEKEQSKSKKYDIFAADEVMVDDIEPKKAPKQQILNVSGNNREMTLLQLLGNDKPANKDDDLDDFPGPKLKVDLKKKARQMDFFDGMDV